jgi:hypothetical protein
VAYQAKGNLAALHGKSEHGGDFFARIQKSYPAKPIVSAVFPVPAGVGVEHRHADDMLGVLKPNLVGMRMRWETRIWSRGSDHRI